VTVPFWIRIDVGNGHQSYDDEARKYNTGQPRIEVDEHFLQSKEIPGGLRWIGRAGWIRRIFKRRLQRHRPPDQYDGQYDHANQFGVDQIRPRQNFLGRFFLFDERFAFRYALVVSNSFTHRKPCEEWDKKQHSDDRHVVGLRDDEPEVRIQYAQPQE